MKPVNSHLPHKAATSSDYMKRTFTVIILLFSLTACREKVNDSGPDPSFSEYVTSFTSGEISTEAALVIQLAGPVDIFEQGNPLPQGIFSLKPEAKGSLIYLSGGTLRFRPDTPFKSATSYRVSLDLSKLLDIKEKTSKFEFTFSTIAQNLSFSEDGLHTSTSLEAGLMSWSGSIITADAAAPEKLRQTITATLDGQPVTLVMTSHPDRRPFNFMADSIVRHETREKRLNIKWNGKPLDVNQSGSSEIIIPPRNQFKLLNYKTIQSPSQQVIVSFTDPVQTGQIFEGLIEFDNQSTFTWQIDRNLLILFPSGHMTGSQKLTLFKGIKSVSGQSLTDNYIINPVFRNHKPEVRLLGKGVILPSGGRLSFPFEAVSLSAVDLRIIKVYASNVRQFLQENTLDGSSDLKKTGRLVYSGKVDLMPGNQEKLRDWNTYRLDINRYITPEQGAIYRVEIRIKKAYSLYECDEPYSAETDETTESSDDDWDAPGWYSLYYWPRGYNWQQRDNPCHVSYYTSDRFVSRNIFASDLGIIAKEGKNHHFTFVVANINTTAPEEKVTLTLYDYQHQPMGRATTDSRGMATIRLTSKPFVAVASKGIQTGYLRLDDGSSLSMSNFDVSGEEIQEGIKGFIYGERGVWRPGDKLYITFILDDPDKRIPVNTPVIFKLINARGQEVNRQVSAQPENGFYHFVVSTRPDDPTGNWYARIQAGGAIFERRIKVETVKPNRLKINLKLPETIQTDGSQKAVLTAAWLHGATAPGLKAVVEAELFAIKTIFKGYEKFSFDNPGSAFTPSGQIVFDGRLDNAGRTEIALKMKAQSGAPGKLRAWFTTRVFEAGGDFSIDVRQTEFSPFNKYLGIRMPEAEDGWYMTNTDYEPELIALSAEGKPVPAGKVEVSLYKIDWRWWWESGEDHLAHYVSGNQFQPVQQWSLDMRDSRAKIRLNVPWRDWRDNGRYLLYVKDITGGHASGTTFYMSQWGSWRNESMPDGATILTLKTDKEKYAPGEKIRVKIPSSPKGHALVSLENGREVKDIFWVAASENETLFEIGVKEGMAPTLYIHVTLLQPYGDAQNDAPIRLYGVTRVTVEDPGTVLNPQLITKEETEPEKEFSVTIKEEAGKPMTYTIAIVDEGLLDLTGFKTPDPHAHFYAREALGVKTYDLYDFVAGAYGARLEKAFAVGGDQDMVASGKNQANRFEPVVIFAGPFTLNKNGSKTHTFKMPNYVGSVKAMVVAGNQGAFGKTEKEIKVRKSVMLLGTLPRIAAPNEQITFPVSVFAMKENARQVTLEIETNDLIITDGSRSQTLTFSQTGEKTVWFNLRTNSKTGIARIKVTGRSGNETATWQTEMQIRNPNPAATFSESRLIDPGQSWDALLQVPEMAEGASASIELGSIPGLNLKQHLEALIQYPYGCTEQVTSGAFAQLYLENLTTLNAAEVKRTEENIRAAIQRLQAVQTGGGGFAYWPGQNSADDWCTSYAGHFIVLAEQKGYAVPAEMRKKWLAWQRSKARDWKLPVAADPYIREQESLMQAYRLYTLSLAGSPEQGLMNRFREEAAGYPLARWRLAAAYLLAGQPTAASQLLQNAGNQTSNYLPVNPTFGSTLRDKAMMLETLVLRNDRQGAFLLLQEIAGELGVSTWLNTQSAAWSFYAVSRFFGSWKPEVQSEFTIRMDGKTENYKSEVSLIKIPAATNRQGQLKATIANTGKAPLFARLVVTGIPVEPASGSTENNLQMQVWFTGRDGNRIEPASMKQGTDLFMNVTVKHPGNRGTYRHLALHAVFPSGWEILNRRVSDMPGSNDTDFDYQDIRDDRVYTFFSLSPGTSRSFRFALNAAYKGRFRFPGLICGDMYDNTIYASNAGLWVEVTD